MSDSITVSTSSRSHHMTTSSQYPSSSYEQSIKRSVSSSSTARFGVTPIQVGRMTPPLESPISPVSGGNGSNNLSPTASKQTPLQRHLAHLARHGINGLSSAPGDIGGSESLSAESPHNSFVNVGNGIHGTHAAQMSGTSVATSYMGSMGSLGSLKGRFSRFGSLAFGRNKG